MLESHEKSLMFARFLFFMRELRKKKFHMKIQMRHFVDFQTLWNCSLTQFSLVFPFKNHQPLFHISFK